MTAYPSINQRVICVAGQFLELEPGEIPPKQHGIYTIRAVVVIAGQVAVQLVEIINPPLACGIECAYSARGFRPIDDSALEVFRGLLKPTQEAIDRFDLEDRKVRA